MNNQDRSPTNQPGEGELEALVQQTQALQEDYQRVRAPVNFAHSLGEQFRDQAKAAESSNALPFWETSRLYLPFSSWLAPVAASAMVVLGVGSALMVSNTDQDIQTNTVSLSGVGVKIVALRAQSSMTTLPSRYVMPTMTGISGLSSFSSFGTATSIDSVLQRSGKPSDQQTDQQERIERVP